MTLQQKRQTTTIVALILSVAVVFTIGSIPSVLAQTQPAESLSVTSDKDIYKKGEKIHLEIRKPIVTQQKVITDIKTEYAGIISPCGTAYFDFAFLEGDYSNITTYEQLVAVNDKTLNVLYSQPYSAYMCPLGYVVKIEKVTDDVTKGKSVSSIITSDNGRMEMDVDNGFNLDLTNIYGKTSIRSQIGPNEILEYVDSKPIQAGKYTIIAFTLDGDISKPLVIEVTDIKPVGQTTSLASDELFAASASNNANMGDWLFSLFTLPAALGMITFATKKPKISLKVKSWFAIVILVLGVVPIMGSNDAFAIYNVGSKGIEHRGTDTTFKTTTVEDRFEGVRPSTNGQHNGFSVQNNHFVENFAVGNGFHWAQSTVQIETPNSPTYNTHTCTTQDATYLCQLPNQLNFRGVTNFWTDDTSGSCPTGFEFVSSSGLCVDVDVGTWKGWGIGSDITRVDVNAYQQLQLSGRIYMDQKVRFCTGSFSCGSYTTLFTAPTNTYANSNSYYNSDVVFGATEYGTQTLGGECGGCNGGTGRITFDSGTYLTKVYTVQGPGNPVYRASGDDNWPTEDNDDICWWDSITDGGSTFTTTARQDTACQS